MSLLMRDESLQYDKYLDDSSSMVDDGVADDGVVNETGSVGFPPPIDDDDDDEGNSDGDVTKACNDLDDLIGCGGGGGNANNATV
jgi:hypothetical protein